MHAERRRFANAAARHGEIAATPALTLADARGVKTRSSARNKRSVALAFPGLSDLIDSISPPANVTVMRLAYNIAMNSDRSMSNASPEMAIRQTHATDRKRRTLPREEFERRDNAHQTP